MLSETPALLTRMSTHPYCEVTLLNSALTAFKSLKSGLIPTTVESGYFSFNCATAFWADCIELAVKITVAPSLKNASAVAYPIPLLPPVIIATLSFNLINIHLVKLICLVYAFNRRISVTKSQKEKTNTCTGYLRMV